MLLKVAGLRAGMRVHTEECTSLNRSDSAESRVFEMQNLKSLE